MAERSADLAARVNRAPERNAGHQRDQSEQAAEKKIHPINQGVLYPDVDDVPVFSHAPILLSTAHVESEPALKTADLEVRYCPLPL